MRTAFITGGAGGIGRAIVKELSGKFRVVISGRTDGVHEVAEELACEAIVGSLDTPESVQHLASAVGEKFQVDVLVNNAGVAKSAPFGEMPLKLWHETLMVNVSAPFMLCRAFVPGMAERGWGRIINIASTAGVEGHAYVSAYCASKHALVGLTRSMAAEFAQTGVTSNAVCPGWVETPMSQRAIDNIAKVSSLDMTAARKSLEKMSPQGRMMQPAEVANIVGMLVRDESRGINGQSIVVDGGGVTP